MKQQFFLKPRRFKPWIAYRNYVETALQAPSAGQARTPDYLSNRLFTQAILYGLPAGFLALIPAVYVSLQKGHWYLGAFGAGIMLVVALVSLLPRVPMSARKLTVSGALVLTAIMLIAFLGSFGIGCTYLLTFSVFYALHFSGKFALRAMWVNVAVCVAFALAISLKLIHTEALEKVTLMDWLTYSANFLFLNGVIVVMIRQTIARLERTMRKEAEIHEELKNDFFEKQLLHLSLRESESRYRTLFTLSPSAKLVFSIDTLRFIETNKAATEIYGYSAKEFLELRLTDLHLDEDIPHLLRYIEEEPHADGSLPTLISQHIRKDGSVIHVEILRSNINMKGNSARMIVVNDITRQVEQVDAIQKQNEKLKEIAYIQSHLVRMPLTKIMALTQLIADEFKGSGDTKLLEALSKSADELDQHIRKIIGDSATILDDLDKKT